MEKRLPTKNSIKTLLRYDPKSGEFYRLRNNSRADTPMKIGYRRVRAKVGETYYEFLAHRLAWLMTYGEWPEKEIDHINGDRADNSIANLRHVGRGKNAKNLKLRFDNSSGASGLWKLPYGSWRVRIGRKHVGCYETKDQAMNARAKYLMENGYTDRHGRALL